MTENCKRLEGKVALITGGASGIGKGTAWLGGLVVGVTGLVVALMNALAGVTNVFVWINPVIYLILTLGFGWFYFKEK